MSLLVSVLNHVISIIVKVIIFVSIINMGSRLCHHQLFLPDISDHQEMRFSLSLFGNMIGEDEVLKNSDPNLSLTNGFKGMYSVSPHHI